jgi:hypothetical protein
MKQKTATVRHIRNKIADVLIRVALEPCAAQAMTANTDAYLPMVVVERHFETQIMGPHFHSSPQAVGCVMTNAHSYPAIIRLSHAQ